MASTAPWGGRGSGPLPGTDRVWLDVPYADKDAAKAAGARWDPAVKRWYVGPAGRPDELARWAPRPPVPELLPGEDRAFGAGLFVDLVPASCWFTNARTCVTPGDWERLRRMVTARAGHSCEVCGAPEVRAPGRALDVHERWDYDLRTGVQQLRRLICLCERCHEVTHFGLANTQGRAEAALAHLRAVTGMNIETARAHVDGAFTVWRSRSAACTWSLDLSILTDAGVALAAPPPSKDRAATAAQRTAAVREQESSESVPRRLLRAVSEGVVGVRYSTLEIAHGEGSDTPVFAVPKPAAGDLAAAPNCMWILSAWETHTAAVRMERWDAPPPQQPIGAEPGWERVQEASLDIDADGLMTGIEITGNASDVQLHFLPGRYRVRAYVRGGRELVAAALAGLDDEDEDGENPHGIEQYLVQFWPAQLGAAAAPER